MFDNAFLMWYYVQAIRETASEKHEIKIFKKVLKNVYKMLDISI